MKTIITLAAVAAALANASVASAHDSVGGHWVWRTQLASGPRATVPSLARGCVKDSESRMTIGECAMMKADATRYMMDMRGSGAARPNG